MMFQFCEDMQKARDDLAKAIIYSVGDVEECRKKAEEVVVEYMRDCLEWDGELVKLWQEIISETTEAFDAVDLLGFLDLAIAYTNKISFDFAKIILREQDDEEKKDN